MSAAAARSPDWFLAQGDFVYREPDPPVFVAAAGATLTDDRGRRYLDAEAGNGAVALGYDATLLGDASRRAAELPSLPSFCESALRRRVAERLASRMEEATGLGGRVAFELGGAQGMELALRIALRNVPRTTVMVFEGAYHGRSAWTSQLSASQRYRAGHGSWSSSVRRLPYPDCERCRFGRRPESCHTECVSFVESLLADELAGLVSGPVADVAAFVLEPVLNVGGMVFPDPRYVEGAVAALRARGALIIVDEVFTGLYRTGRPFGFQHYNFVPDIVVLSKALTNGMAPLSCVWAREPLAAPASFPPGTHSVTFGNNPLSLAIAEAVLDRFDAWTGLPEHLQRLEGWLRDGLVRAAAHSGLVARVDARGAIGRLKLREPRAAELRQVALGCARDAPVDGHHGLVVASTGMAPDTVCVHPPLSFGEGEVACMSALLARSLALLEAR